MQTPPNEVLSILVMLITKHPREASFITVAGTLGVLKRSRLSLKLGFSSKVFGAWLIQVDHGKDASGD
jgi:hypothetical protein